MTAPTRKRAPCFLYLNTGKQGLTLNLKHPQGREILKALARDADVLVENFAPRVMPSLGLDLRCPARRQPAPGHGVHQQLPDRADPTATTKPTT